jgi:hypothetical protein
MSSPVRGRDPRHRIAEIQMILAQYAAAKQMFEMPGWKVFQRAIEVCRHTAVEALATDPYADLAREQATIAVYTTLRNALRPNPTDERKLVLELEGLQKDLEALHDARLLPKDPR